MIRRSKKGKNATKKTTTSASQIRSVSSEKPAYYCKKCKKKGTLFKTYRKQEMEKHVNDIHDTKREKGVDLKVFFEMLRVAGVIGIVVGIYEVSTHIADQYVETTPILSDTKYDVEIATGTDINIDQSKKI